MTYEDAIPYLECGAVPSCCCSSNKRHGGNCEGEEKVVEAINLAIKAIEKQIPMLIETKKSRNSSDEGYYVCPNCKGEFAVVGSEAYFKRHNRHNYCDICGQKISFGFWE